MNSRDVETTKLLDRCYAIANNPRANSADRRLAVDAAYDMGLAEGRLIGKIEMGEAITGVKVEVPT